MSEATPGPKDLRTFAFTFSAILGIVGAAFLWRRGSPGLIVWGAGLLILAAGLFAPRALAPVYSGWMAFARLLETVTSHVLLALIYYLILTPIGILRRICGGDTLRKGIDRGAGTYWIRRDGKETDKEQYEKMF